MLNQKIKDGIKAVIYLLVLTLINIYIPFLSVFVLVVWPIPVAVITLKYDLNTTAAVIAIMAILSGLLFGPMLGLMAVIGYGLVGFVIGNCIKEGIKPLRTLLFTIGAVLVSHLLLLYVSRYMLGIDFQSIINEVTRIIGQTGNMSGMEDMISSQIQLLQRIFPALIGISAIITGSLNYYVTNWYIRKTGYKRTTYKNIKYWFLPRWFISLGIVVSLILQRNIFFVNLNMLLLFLALIQGYAVAIYFIDKKTDSSLFKVIFTAVVLFIPIFPPAVILLGLVDFWFDFRKLKNNKKQA
ncbi:MAG TPA: DUF2232 domain-containing protein [Halanaerobiales bacterium]|nr:DUF2232 domain-containing protein [Halanaerobiales bacterium]